MSWLGRLLSQFDPTRKKSFVAGIGRQIDPTNRNSLVGKVAPFAVGAIPGIGLPLAAGLGAGLRASQAVGRGAGIGEIAGSALRGGVEAGMTRGIARAVMPGTFAPSTAIPGAPAALDMTALGNEAVAAANAPFAAAPASVMPAGGGGLTGIGARALGQTGGGIVPGAIKPAVDTIGKPGQGWLAGLGRRLTSPEVLAAGLQTGANIYGAGQIGAAEDQRLAWERARAEREANRIGFDEWKRRRDAARIGGTPTPV